LQAAKWGLNDQLRRKNLEPPMSLLGQTLHIRGARATSASPPISDIPLRRTKWRFGP
jgi:hypothetical protein